MTTRLNNKLASALAAVAMAEHQLVRRSESEQLQAMNEMQHTRRELKTMRKEAKRDRQRELREAKRREPQGD